MARAREKERGDKGIERQQVTSPYVRHKPLLRERGGTCSLPEVGGGGSNLLEQDRVRTCPGSN